jgi:DNA-binding response OmpR family regulator
MIRVLLVDGDEGSNFVVDSLSSRELSVELAAGSGHAFRCIADGRYDAIVIDPDVLGADLTAFLDALRSGDSLIISAHGGKRTPLPRDSAIALVIHKPYDVELLVHLIRASVAPGGKSRRPSLDKKPFP